MIDIREIRTKKDKQNLYKTILICFIIIVSIILIYLLYQLLVEMLTTSQSELIVKALPSIISFPAVLNLFILIFRREIGKFINNAEYFKGLGVEAGSQANRNREIESKNTDPEKKLIAANEEKGIEINNKDAESQLLEVNEEKETDTIREQRDPSSEVKNNIEPDKTVKNLTDLTLYYANRAEMYEFGYLRYFLVENSKQALLWFYNRNYSTKEVFINQFPLKSYIGGTVVNNPNSFENQVIEKENIYEALLTNDLIKNDGGKISLTDKGIKFLRFIDYING